MSNPLFKVMCIGTSTGGGTIVDGDGTSIATPYVWDLHCESNRYQSTIFNNYESNYEDNSKIYIKVKLLAGTYYFIGMNEDKSFDGKIWLYDTNGNEIGSNDDTSEWINGIACRDVLIYVPETDGDYIIAAGYFATNPNSGGEFYIVMNPAPEKFQGDTAEVGTKNNPYILSDIYDPSYYYWTHFINVNPGDGAWIKLEELPEGWNCIIGVSRDSEDGSVVNSNVMIYDYNFIYQDTMCPDGYLEVEGVPVGSVTEHFPQYSRRLLY